MRTAIRLGTTLAIMALTSIATMSWAFAQEDYQTPPTVLPTVERAPEVGAGGAAGGGTAVAGEVAFTGFQLTVWMALLLVLVAIGVALIWASRRRSGPARHTA